MDHLTLEHEIAEELNPLPTGAAGGNAPARRRETVLSMLSQSAQLAHNFVDLLNEAGFLAAAVLKLDFFAGVEITGSNVMRMSFGSVTDSANSVVPMLRELIWDAPRTSFQFAIESGHPIVIADLAGEDRFDDAFLAKHGIQSGVICPIDYKDEHFGAIGYFASTARKFTRDDVLFLQSVALFLGPTRAHQKSERALAEHSRFLSSAIDSLEAMVVLLNAEGGILQINRGCQSLGGFTLAELRGRRIWSAFWQPEESASAESVISELRSGAKQAKREAYFVSKQGATRRVSWTFSKLQEGNGAGPVILATGIDITEQHLALKRLDEVNRSQKAPSPPPDAPEKKAANQEPSERRVHDRRPYQCIQMVAPCLDGRLPGLDQFREVRCYDISPRGFSFLLSTRPTFDELVATFGSATSRLYLRAVIRHITPIQFEGRKVLLIGCEYVGRVRMPNAPA
jgi:PAS domain S-box-containing protein